MMRTEEIKTGTAPPGCYEGFHYEIVNISFSVSPLYVLLRDGSNARSHAVCLHELGLVGTDAAPLYRPSPPAFLHAGGMAFRSDLKTRSAFASCPRKAIAVLVVAYSRAALTDRLTGGEPEASRDGSSTSNGWGAADEPTHLSTIYEDVHRL
jgi:hypothetical protein